MIIVNFAVACTIDGRPVFDLTTVFGFFPPDVLEKQVGLSVSDAQRLELTEPCGRVVALVGEPSPYFGGTLALGNGRLRMLDQVTGFWPEGGTHGLGRLRAERHIDVGDWYFKSHFFQDPVQPGSLGIEAMIQLLQFYLIESGAAEGIPNAQFEPLARDIAMSWKYRGQVVPTNDLVHVTMDITDLVHDAGTVVVTATASLWCDGIRIYSADNLGVRVISGTPSGERGVMLDPAVDTWLGDHRPTWNRPALPMMSIVDMLAKAVPGNVIGVRDVQVGGWVDFVGPRQFVTNVEQLGESEYSVRLMSEGTQVASAVIYVGSYPERPEPLAAVDGVEMEDPYISGRLFHGPAFRLQVAGTLGADGASTILDSGRGQVPVGRLHPGLLDAALHGIPHDQLHLWADEIADDRVAFPARIVDMKLYGSTPTKGTVRCEVRFDGFLVSPELPRFSVQLITDEGVWATFTIIEACLPKGPIGSAEPGARRSFLADHTYVPGLSLSKHEDGATRLDRATVASTDWMPGTVLGIFGTDDPEAIAVKEHLANRSELHPFLVPAAVPLHPPVDLRHEGDQIIVRSQAGLDLDRINRFWAERLGVDRWLGQDLTEGLVRKYVRDVVFEDPVGFDQTRQGGVIFVANHQVQLESILITHLLPVLLGHDVVTMANAKHATRWVGWLSDRLCTYPGAAPVNPIVYFDQARPDSMAEVLSGLRDDLSHGRRSLFVHAQGTRSRFAPDPVTKLSSTFLDLAVGCDIPIVPVRFSGGLSAAPLEDKLEIPLGAQDYVVGGPITPDEIASWPYGERRRRVLDALNNVGGRQVVTPTDVSFEAGVESWSASTGARQVESTFIRVLEAIEDPSPETLRLLHGARSGELVVGSEPVDVWLAEVACVLYGPDGPRVRRG
ncbi:MAG: polyketide synthase dehydratase domain-containing protein [Acidimicrobiia bacterium]|nr:polyketide synthase dehydratase domain-containing protein [Acidimicrobiia bacterium]